MPKREIISEKVLEKGLKGVVELLDGKSYKWVSPGYTGVTDQIVCLPEGRAAFAEIKTTGKRPTSRQLLVHQELRDLGFIVWVIDDWDSMAGFIKAILK